MTLVHRIYTRDGWAAQFSGCFSPVLGCQTWTELDWTLLPDDQRMVYHGGRGRRRVNRLRGPMDHTRRQTRRGPTCPRCGRRGHDLSNCPQSHPPSDRASGDNVYDPYGQYGM